MAHQSDDVVEVAETFGEVARSLAVHEDLPSTLDKIVNLAVEHLKACEYAGISLVEGRNITSPASSKEIPRIVDRIQSETDEGPCIDAIKEHAVFETGDLREEGRWPQFAQRAYEEAGIVSVLSLRLFVGESTFGALNLYSSAEHAFDETDVALGSVFAVHAAVAMQAAHHDESLEQKVRSRDVIGQAKGILMARSGVDEDRAFEMLKAASQRMNVKLRDVAEHISSGRSLAGSGDPTS
ncbi:MAG: GAF and ANTAR domain-containing protein [Actinomycetota bacterium]|nr:GAF and ANTAR domain-containing protein [Actinomycetota bacterium]